MMPSGSPDLRSWTVYKLTFNLFSVRLSLSRACQCVTVLSLIKCALAPFECRGVSLCWCVWVPSAYRVWPRVWWPRSTDPFFYKYKGCISDFSHLSSHAFVYLLRRGVDRGFLLHILDRLICTVHAYGFRSCYLLRGLTLIVLLTTVSTYGGMYDVKGWGKTYESLSKFDL